MKSLTEWIDESRFERPISIIRAIVHELRAEKVTFMAGSIAYHAFVSMLPLLVLVLTIISTVGDRSLETAFVSFVERVLTPSTGGVLIDQLETAGTSTGLSILGLGVLLWGTLRIFRGLDTAFSDIYLASRKSSKKAMVATARKLLVSIFHMLDRKEVYDPPGVNA